MAILRLSDRGVGALKLPPEGQAQIDYWDALTPSFGVRVSRGGRKAFFVATRVEGRLRRFTLKPPFPQLSLADAREKARKIIADAQRGVDPQAAKAEARAAALKRKRNSFGAVAAEFMESHAKNLRSRDQVERLIRVELLPHWADRPITSITRGDIKELLRDKAKVSVSSADRLLPQISKIFAWALDEEIIAASPAMRLPRQGEATERERVLSPAEIRVVWAAFDRMAYPFGKLFKMLLLTAQRRSEVAGMKWAELDVDGWLLPGARAKSKSGHRVPLSSFAREILEGLPRIGEHVFIARADKPVRGWSKAKARLNELCWPRIADWHLHDLRRTAATQMRSLGVDRLTVSKILNHAEAGVTKVYDRHAADPEKAAALELWGNRLGQILAGDPDGRVVTFRRAKG
jgi:integrase